MRDISPKQGKLVTFAWIVLIFISSGLPKTPGEGLIPHFNVVGHFAQFFVLAAFLLFLVPLNWKKAVPLNIIIAVSVEIYQLFLPWRAFQYFDLLVDFSGIATATVAWKIVLNKHNLIK